MNSLQGKHFAVLGVADQESIAWAIARRFVRAGARVTIGYQHKFLSRVRTLQQAEPELQARRCDVLNTDELEEFFSGQRFDGLVHSIAWGPASVFTRDPSQVTSRDFSETLEVSTHSLAKVVRHARAAGALLPGASVLTLTFQASERAMPMYGMMGVAKAALESLVRYLAVELGRDRIRVNCISAGPVETLAALSEIIAFRRDPAALERLPGRLMREAIGAELAQTSPLAAESHEGELEFARRCWRRVQQGFAERSAIPELLTADDVADTAVFLAGDSSKRITGQVIKVDCGFSACEIG